MPPTRTEAKSKGATRQLTLTGELASVPPSSSSSAKSRLKSTIERAYTDAILSLKPQFIGLIEKKEKNYEYRKYEMRETVIRVWFYITAPTSAITHVMVTSKPKTPGQVCDPNGIGNDDFDNGKKESKFGYPVLGLYKLKTPLKAEEMRIYGISTPQGPVYAPKKMVDELPLEDMEKVFSLSDDDDIVP